MINKELIDNNNKTNIVILRIGHRPQRDKRVTTHVALTARAFGASGILINSKDPYIVKNIESVVERFGGPFFIRDNINAFEEIKKYKNMGWKICHLSMYGICYSSVINDIKKEKNIILIVGAEKVSGEYYNISDWNIGVGNQPHSEIAAIAIFLDRYFLPNTDRLVSKFNSPKLTIIPSNRGKFVKKIDI